MSVLKRINEERLEARKSGNKVKATILTTLYGEASPTGNETVTDEQVYAKIKKFIKNNDEVLGYRTDDNLVEENAILQSLLPRSLSEDELEGVIEGIVKDMEAPTMKDMGKVMGKLKELYSSRYDGKVASTLVRKHLA